MFSFRRAESSAVLLTILTRCEAALGRQNDAVLEIAFELTEYRRSGAGTKSAILIAVDAIRRITCIDGTATFEE